MKQRWGVIALVSVISFLSGGWLLQRGTGGPERVPAGPAVRRRPGPRQRLLRGLAGRDRSLREGHERHAGAAQGSLFGPAHRRRLQGAHRADLGQLRRPGHPDRRARRLDHGGGPAARNARRAGRRADGRPDHRGGRQVHRGLEERRGGQGAPRRSGQQGDASRSGAPGFPTRSSSISPGPRSTSAACRRAPCSTAASATSRSTP